MTNERRQLVAIAVVACAFVLGIVRLVGLVSDTAVNLPFEDQWDLLGPLFDDSGPLACFHWQHGPHRQGLGGLINWYLYRATAWDARMEAWTALVILVLAAAAMVAVATRLRGRIAWTDAGFPLLTLSAVHWETMLLTPNIAHSILPLLLVLLLTNAWILKNPSWRVVAVGASSGPCLFTGFGLCGAVAAFSLALFIWIRPQRDVDALTQRQVAVVLTILLGAVFAFSIGYHWEPAVPGWRFPVDHWWDYGRFVALMFTSLLGWRSITMGSTAAGIALLVLVGAVFGKAAFVLWRRDGNARTLAVWMLTGTSLCYAAFTAIGRLPVNIEAAFMWRYTTLMMPGLCGLALAVEKLAESCSRLRRNAALWGWIFLCCVIWCNFVPERSAAITADAKSRWIAAYLQTHDLVKANQESDFWVYLPAPASSVIAERLEFLEEHRLAFFRKATVDPR